MGITLKQLALEAGVSMATVSLALNGSENVAEKTRKRILKLAHDKNYQPNLVARSLAGGNNYLMGILIDSKAPRVLFRLLAYIEREAGLHGYRIMIGEAHNNVQHLHEIYDTFRQYNVSGVICLAHDYPGQEDELKRLFNNCRNIVYIGRPKLDHASYVSIDRGAAMAQAIDHLESRGYKRIGMMCNAIDYRSTHNRIASLKQIMQERGIDDITPMLFKFDEDVEGGYGSSNLERFIEEKVITGEFDAVMLESDVNAGMLCKLLAKRGISVPGDFGVIGSDNDDICIFCYPELTSIDDAQERQAEEAVKMLLSVIADKKAESIDRHVIVSSKLVIRESTMRNIKK